MLRRLVGMAALTVALLVGTAAPGLAEDATPGRGTPEPPLNPGRFKGR